MKVIVLAGGLSLERDVSLSSGSLIANALIERGHEVLLLDLYLGDTNYRFIKKSDNYKYNYEIPAVEPNLEELTKKYGNNPIGPNVIKLCQNADIVFMALHGGIGENGELQKIFDENNIKYTGSNSLGCQNAMDKDLSKKIFIDNDILTPKWIKYPGPINNVHYPVIVKPQSNGSSIGVYIVNNENELNNALNKASKYEKNILIEEYIKGREFSVGILNNEALPIIEIIPKQGFYDYKNKYQNNLTTEICPASLDEKITVEMQNIALKVHNVLKLGFYSRIDFILNNQNKIYCLEANTLPGMTPNSLLPQEAKQKDISYEDLCEAILINAK